MKAWVVIQRHHVGHRSSVFTERERERGRRERERERERKRERELAGQF